MKLQICKLYTVIEKSSQEKKEVASSPRDEVTTVFQNPTASLIEKILFLIFSRKISTRSATSIHA
jgi:hypothetical protein